MITLNKSQTTQIDPIAFVSVIGEVGYHVFAAVDIFFSENKSIIARATTYSIGPSTYIDFVTPFAIEEIIAIKSP